MPLTCSIEHCSVQSVARGWCDMHYRRWRRTGDPEHTRRIIGDDRERFLSHVDQREGDECWLWQGSHNAPRYGTPYGTFRYQNRTRPAHVVSYLLANGRGAIPDGVVLDHLCRTTLCVNPAHLEPVAHSENVRRGRRTKVPAAQVPGLKKRNAAGESLTSLAREVGVSPQALRLRFQRVA